MHSQLDTWDASMFCALEADFHMVQLITINNSPIIPNNFRKMGINLPKYYCRNETFDYYSARSPTRVKSIGT